MKSSTPKQGVDKVGQIQQLPHPKRILWKICLWQDPVGKCCRQKYAHTVSLTTLALGCFFPWCKMGEPEYSALRKWTASYLVNGFVDKSSHFPDKDGLQKVMWGATLPFTAVWYCFCVLTGKGEQTSDSQFKQYRQSICCERLLHFSGSTPSIRKEKNRNLCPCFTPSSSVISTKGDWDTCGLRLLLFYFIFLNLEQS